MTVETKFVRLQGAVRRVVEAPGGTQLMVHIDDSLVAVEWEQLRAIPAAVTVKLGEGGKGRTLAGGVAVDEAWAFDAASKSVLLARPGAIEAIDPGGRREIAIEGLPKGTFGMVPDAGGQRVLLVVVRDVNPDFSEFGLAIADLASGKLTMEGAMGANADLDVVWDERFRSWAICDSSTGGLWRWDGVRAAWKLAGARTGRVHGASLSLGGEGALVSGLDDGGVVSGRADWDRVVWEAPVKLAGSGAIAVARHPSLPLYACLERNGAQQSIQFYDQAGKRMGETLAPVGSHVTKLEWSPNSAKRLWAVGVKGFAEIQLSA